MFKVGDTVKIIATKERLENIGIWQRIKNKTGTVDRVNCNYHCSDEVLTIAVTVEDAQWFFTESDLQLVTTDAVKVLKDRYSKKETNPKDSIGISKTPLSTISVPVIAEVGLAMLEGALKYGRHNYRVAGVRASIYFDATFRHLGAWWEGEDIDPDSGLSHITKAIAGLTVLRDSMLQENWVDDRPPKSKDGWIQEFNKKVKKLLEKYPDSKEPFTELNRKD